MKFLKSLEGYIRKDQIRKREKLNIFNLNIEII
jgi:hypothetical protein